jgi:pilus assembly protein CpaE
MRPAHIRIESADMSAVTPNEAAQSWKASRREESVQLYLSEIGGDAAELAGARAAGFPLSLNLVASSDWIEATELSGAPAAIVQVDPGNPASIKRFHQLASKVETPLIAAAYEPPLALVRALVRAGAHDVIPLPLSLDELETSLAPVRDELIKRKASVAVAKGKLVTAIKGVGGVGATSLLTQLAIRFAEKEGLQNREVCLADLDVQFGDVAFQLGLHPKLSLSDLLEAGSRLDSALLRATTSQHASGLNIIAPPADMMPLESIANEQLLQIVDLATREFGTVFVDLPTNWTNWSLSLVARSDIILLITEMTVAGLSRARRQLNLLQSQDLDVLNIRIVMNRVDRATSRSIRPADVREALGRDVAFNISNDGPLMRAAIDRGVPIDEIKRKSGLAKDFDLLDAGIAASLELGR